MEALVPKFSSRRYTVREYFKLAAESPTKLEYKAGQIIDMAGGSLNHNRISANLVGELRQRLKGGPCEAIGSDQRISSADDRYCYPDVSVICDGPRFDPIDPHLTIMNPKVLCEVLSPSTESADRGEKFFRYIRLPSMAEYFLVSQDKPRVERFFRQPDGTWGVGDVIEGLEATVPFRSLGFEVPMAEVYANVRFEPASGPVETPEKA